MWKAQIGHGNLRQSTSPATTTRAAYICGCPRSCFYPASYLVLLLLLLFAGGFVIHTLVFPVSSRVESHSSCGFIRLPLPPLLQLLLFSFNCIRCMVLVPVRTRIALFGLWFWFLVPFLVCCHDLLCPYDLDSAVDLFASGSKCHCLFAFYHSLEPLVPLPGKKLVHTMSTPTRDASRDREVVRSQSVPMYVLP